MKYDANNVFAKILRGEIPCNKAYEDKWVLSFHDIEPEAPIHILVIPKGYYCNFHDFITRGSEDEIMGFFNGIKETTLAAKITDYRLITNSGEKAGQSVFHFHCHIISGKKFNKLL